ncbi:ATP synthase F0 sector subunit b' [hydrothermal vent metagenome]|uniref:ATP synthase F0 sector subunit b n=1 Tax=hydrothermal vent metagenome TaxID=652676 RepID=A0A3B0TVW6_9ZZZZ
MASDTLTDTDIVGENADDPTIIVENGEVVDTESKADTYAETQADPYGEEDSVFPPFDSTTFGAQLFWLALTFGILYIIMSKVALPRIGEILEVRRDRIEGDLAEAERLRQKTDQAIETYKEELTAARAKSHGIADETRNKIKSQMDEKRREVEADLAKQIASAEARILKTKTDALSNVDQIAAETAVALVGKLTGKVSIKTARVAVNAVVKE